MAVSLFQKILNRMFQQFVNRTGREPMTPQEWMSIQNSAVNYLNKTNNFYYLLLLYENTNLL